MDNMNQKVKFAKTNCKINEVKEAKGILNLKYELGIYKF